MKSIGKVGKLRMKGDKKALSYYLEHHRPVSSNELVYCQIGGELVHPSQLTPAHKVGRRHIAPGMEEGQGEHPSNILAACWTHHQRLDLNIPIKNAVIVQPVSCLEGGILDLTPLQKKILEVKYGYNSRG